MMMMYKTMTGLHATLLNGSLHYLDNYGYHYLRNIFSKIFSRYGNLSTNTKALADKTKKDF